VGLDALEERDVQLAALGLVGDVQDDQPTGAQLLGDVLLGVGVDLAARGAPAESMARKA